MVETRTVTPTMQGAEITQFPSFYYAVRENQRLWREAKRGVIKSYEMPEVSRRVEENVKRVFAGYIDPSYPRVLLSWALLVDAPKEAVPYNYLVNRFPEQVKTDYDKAAYDTGIRGLDEWATNFATIHYFRKVSKKGLTYPVKLGFAHTENAFQKLAYLKAYRMMNKVKKFARQSGADFDHALFSAYFQHDFSLLNQLIEQTPYMQKREIASLDDLTLHIGKRWYTKYKAEAMKKTSSDTVGDIWPSNPVAKGAARTTASALIGGYAPLGRGEIIVSQPLTWAAIGGLFSAITGGTPAVTASVAGGLTAGAIPYFTIHEAMHAYSNSHDYAGLRPAELVTNQ